VRSWVFPVSSYYYARKRAEEPTARDARDAMLKRKSWGCGKARRQGGLRARKIWLELNRQGIAVTRCSVERLMRELRIHGARGRRKRPRTTIPGDAESMPQDLLERGFYATAPNRRWVTGITYVDTLAGFAYTAFVMDLLARRILGWQVADHLRPDLALDALEMALWVRRHEKTDGLVHHSGREGPV
jgi:putative transposase